MLKVFLVLGIILLAIVILGVVLFRDDDSEKISGMSGRDYWRWKKGGID